MKFWIEKIGSHESISNFNNHLLFLEWESNAEKRDDIYEKWLQGKKESRFGNKLIGSVFVHFFLPISKGFQILCIFEQSYIYFQFQVRKLKRRRLLRILWRTLIAHKDRAKSIFKFFLFENCFLAYIDSHQPALSQRFFFFS